MIMGVSGDIGSFSEEAALLYAKSANINPTLKYLIDMEGVLSQVENRSVDIGIFPVMNMQGGLVRMAFDAMGAHSFKVIDELWLDIHQCLLVKPGINLSRIKKIITHSQAIRQCKLYLETNLPNVECIEWQDTAIAARQLAQGQFDETTAVIASAQAGKQYGLDVLAKNIQDSKPNYTIFIIVRNRGEEK